MRIESSLSLAVATLWAALVAPVGSSIQAQEWSIPATESHRLVSQHLEAEVVVQVGLPFGYDGDDGSYRVVLVLDGDVMFGMATELLRLTSFESPEAAVITVGVSYGGFDRWIAARTRDYRPTRSGDRTGPERFRRALVDEIFPLIDDHYATDGRKPLLFGHSTAGLFALRAALDPDSQFSGVVASSPSLEEASEWIEEALNRSEGVVRAAPSALFLSAGDGEGDLPDRLRSLEPRLRDVFGVDRLTVRVMEEASHMAVIPTAFLEGVLWLLRR